MAQNVDSKIPELRQLFLSKYEGNIIDDTYDSRDVEEIKSTESLLRNALRAFRTGGDVKKAAELLHDSLEYRAKFRVRDLTKNDIHPEIMEKNGVYLNGKDKNGYAILYFRGSANKRGHLIKETKEYLSWALYQYYKDNPETPIVLLFDYVGAGVSNVDLDISKFMVKCTNTYYPCILAYTLMFKMPLALEAIWKVIKGFFDAEQSKKTHFVNRSKIQEYIEADQLLPHMLKDD